MWERETDWPIPGRTCFVHMSAMHFSYTCILYICIDKIECMPYLVFLTKLDVIVLMQPCSGSWERYSYYDAHMLSKAYALEKPKVDGHAFSCELQIQMRTPFTTHPLHHSPPSPFTCIE